MQKDAKEGWLVLKRVTWSVGTALLFAKGEGRRAKGEERKGEECEECQGGARDDWGGEHTAFWAVPTLNLHLAGAP